MDKITVYIIAVATLLNAITAILNFYKDKVKKPVDDGLSKKIQKELEPISKELKEIKSDIKRLDKNECKNYLTEFLEDLKKRCRENRH